MKIKSANPYYHIIYWIFVIVTLTLTFGRSWGNSMAAFFFISMLLPIVLGTSYFFNYVLVRLYYLKKKYFRFGLYTFYTIVVSLYLETIVLMFSFIYLGNFRFSNLDPNASDIILLAVVLYLLVFLGSVLLMVRQLSENRQLILQLMEEKEKMKIATLEVVSNRKTAQIAYEDIIYIESMSDYIRIHTVNDQVVSKEKISKIAERLPEKFIRIHRSFIINKERIRHFSYNEVVIDDIQLNIGRSYRKEVKEALKR